jgi:hypothetical protein
MSTPEPVPESPEVVRHRLRRGVAVALLALVLAGLVPTLLTATAGPASAGPCDRGQLTSFSKYQPGGTNCLDRPSAYDRAQAKIVIGCIVGAFGGTMVSVLAGCAAGAVSLIGD